MCRGCGEGADVGRLRKSTGSREREMKLQDGSEGRIRQILRFQVFRERVL